MKRSTNAQTIWAILAITTLVLPLAPTWITEEAQAAGTGGPRVIVAVIDSGWNPYHEFFYEGGGLYPAGSPPSSVTPDILADLGINAAHQIEVTRTGNFNADRATDSTLWNTINGDRNSLWWFEGTNVIATSRGGSGTAILADNNNDAHGVSTVAAVLAAHPEAIILFVEGTTLSAESFAFTHPQVDIISTSYGPVGSAPIPFHLENSYTGVVNQGKLHFGASDNSPSTAIQDSTAGPWWQIGITGFEEGTGQGKQASSGTFADFAGDFTQTLPDCHNCESGLYPFTAGTSFATPRAAGTASKVLLEARLDANHVGGIDTSGTTAAMVKYAGGATITNWELRQALEQAAWVPGLGQYDWFEAIFDFFSIPIIPQIAYAEIGWGVLTPDPSRGVVCGALKVLGVQAGTPPTKSARTCDFMTAIHDSRHAYWDDAMFFSDSWFSFHAITHGDPYIHC